MKIIQLITELHPAGAEKVLLNLSRELKKRGHDISVVSLQPLPEKYTDIVDDLLEANIPVKSLNVTKFTSWKIFKLVNFIKKQIVETQNLASKTLASANLASKKNTAKAVNSDKEENTSSDFAKATTDKKVVTLLDRMDKYSDIHTSTPQRLIIHSHLIHANLASRLVALFINRKQIRIINTIHIAEKRKSKWWHFFLDKLTFRLCDVQTAVSEAAQQHHAEKIGVSKDKMPVIYNGIVPPKQLSEKGIKNLREEWGFEKCSKVIGSVGRLDWQKGYDTFLKIIPELSKKIPQEKTWGIIILGEGPQRGILQKIIDEVKCTNIKIILPGYRKDAADCISALDLFIMPSRYEGFGLTLVEAMAHGVPCICSNADSLPNLIKDYPNGKNIDFTADEFIKQILSHSSLEKQKPYFLFTTENMADEYLKFY
jgi:glycosyltransferase involved in cell wall biosynthesis